MCFAILYRLFSLDHDASLRTAAVALAIVLMLINASWNYFFFRSRNLFHAYLIGVPYSLVAFALLFILLRLDRASAAWLGPYIIYLFYANLWGYRIWKLNPPR